MSDKPDKVALFLPALNDGGAERVFINIASYLKGRSYDIDLLVVKKEGAYLDQLPSDLNVIELGGQGMLRAFMPLLRYIKASKPKAIISALPGPNLITLAAKALNPLRFKTIITQHMHLSADKALAQSVRAKIRFACMRIFYARADEVICVSEGLADDFAQITGVPRARITVIYNPVFDPSIHDLAKQPAAHEWLENNKTTPILLAAGRLAPPKDYETILRALAEIKGARLIILGEGPDRAAIEAHIKALGLEARVSTPGFTDNPYAYMARADVFVHSTTYEGFGNVLVEALVCGAPIVATDCPSGPTEILEGGKYGELVPVGDEKSMAAAIQKALKKKPDTKALHARSECFTIEAIAPQYEALINAALTD